MKSKKILSLILCVLMLFVFSSCSNAQSQQSDVQGEITTSDNAVTDNEQSTADNSVKNNKTTNTDDKNGKETNKDSSAADQKSTSKAEEKTSVPKKKETKTTVKTSTTKKQTTITKKANTCTISIECSTILKNMNDLDSDVKDQIPSNGVILSSRTVAFSKGDSAYDVLQRVCRENKIQMEASWTGTYKSAYIEGINNIYELDCGAGSGWMYQVNGWYPNYGCSRYELKNGDVIKFRYTCNYGKDIGGRLQNG